MRRAAGMMAALALSLTLAPGAGHAERSCAWAARIDSAAVNTLYPDQFANYWITTLPAASGVHLEIEGVFPHARYMSFVAYASTLQSADGVNDVSIEPEPGSTNPFRAGSDRTVNDQHRRYAVNVRYGAPPAQREPNTLYTSNADGTKSGSSFNVIYRVYRPDRADDPAGDMSGDITGGTGLPTVRLVSDAGAIQLPDCPYQDVPPTGLNQQVASQGQQNSGSGPHFPGFVHPEWHKFQNFVRSLSQGLTESEYTGHQISDAAKPVADAFPTGGFADNPDNNYIFALLSHGYGQIAVFRAKLPTTPDTWPDSPLMPGATQLRYWSMCSNDGPSERYIGCVMDDQVRPTLDANGFATLVVSTVADRPATVTNHTCGCVWLPWGPGGSVVMIVRNMLPAPSNVFPNAIQYVTYGNEKAMMGDYYPDGCYLSAAAFDAGTRC